MKINSLQLFRFFLFIGSCVTAGVSAYFGQETSQYYISSGFSGGAIGMGVVSGACLISLAITFLKKKE
jgi:hypothetical protein